MKKIIAKIEANERLPAVLKEIADANLLDTENAAMQIDDTEITQAGIWISNKLGSRGVEATLTTGGLLYFYLKATDCDARKELFPALLEDIGISKSQAYRCMDVWEHFGKLLIDDPRLAKYFVVEALKMLSASDVSPTIREAAIAIARRSERVRISHVENLINKVKTDVGRPSTRIKKAKVGVKENENKKTKKPTPSIWEYAGSAVKFVLHLSTPRSNVSREAIIKDLEAALELLRTEYARDTPKLQNPKSVVGASHV